MGWAFSKACNLRVVTTPGAFGGRPGASPKHRVTLAVFGPLEFYPIFPGNPRPPVNPTAPNKGVVIQRLTVISKDY